MTTATPLPAGIITEFPFSSANILTSDTIITGPDGNLWFTERQGNKIGRISPSGTVTEFPLPSGHSGPNGITVGPDGTLWFTQDSGNIGRITSGV